MMAGPRREGLALLQGLLVCGCCGRRVTSRYKGNGGVYPLYECNWRKREGLSTTSCLSIQTPPLDRAIEQRVLEVVNSDQLNLAIEAFEIVQQRHQQVDKQWQMRLERAQYEAQLAQRRYEQVDPNNRLVASTLEQRWNDALIEVQDVEEQIAQICQKRFGLDTQQREEILALAKDLPKLWGSEKTSPKNKKRFLELLVKDITIPRPQNGIALLQVRWQGGVNEELTVKLPRKNADRWRHDDSLIERVRELARTLSDAEIAQRFNDEGIRSNKGNAFTRSSVSWIRCKHGIPPADKKLVGELTVHEVARQFAVRPSVVYYWIEREIVSARRLNDGSPYWIAINDEKRAELERWVRESKHLKRQ